MAGRNKFELKFSFNSPIILGFTIICFLVLILDSITSHASTNLIFSEYHSSLLNPMTYIRFVGHIFGHAGWDHFMGNIMLILIVGPLLEEKYGSANMIFVILVTALGTGIANYILFPRTQMLGASGVVFALILLSSITSMKSGSIPITFILVAVIYIGQQVYQGIFVRDNVANLSHIIGGIIGAWLGFILNRKKVTR